MAGFTYIIASSLIFYDVYLHLLTLHSDCPIGRQTAKTTYTDPIAGTGLEDCKQLQSCSFALMSSRSMEERFAKNPLPITISINTSRLTARAMTGPELRTHTLK